MSNLSPDRREALQEEIERLRKESRKLWGEEARDGSMHSGLTRGMASGIDREIYLLENELREMS
jgi:hypothetical protein